MRKFKNTRLISFILCVSFLGFLVGPINTAFANEKGEAGNGGEVEFYLDSSLEEPKPKPKPNPKPDPKPKPIIKLPQTGHQVGKGAYLVGMVLIIGTTAIILERRRTHE